MISNATSNAIGSKVTTGGSRSNPELITKGDFADGQEGWTLRPTVSIREGRAAIGPANRPPYASISQTILEDGVSYDVIIEVAAIPERGQAQVLDGRNTSVFNFTSTGQNSFSFTNSTGSGFSIISSSEALVIANVSVKKQ